MLMYSLSKTLMKQNAATVGPSHDFSISSLFQLKLKTSIVKNTNAYDASGLQYSSELIALLFDHFYLYHELILSFKKYR